MVFSCGHSFRPIHFRGSRGLARIKYPIRSHSVVLLLVIVLVIALLVRMAIIHFDHEKLRVYQDGLRFVAFAWMSW